MAKNTKNNLYNFENENKSKNKKFIKKKNKNKNKKEENSEDKFSFDNEIIIGVTKMQEEKKKEAPNNKKKKNKKKKNNKVVNNKNENKKVKNNKKQVKNVVKKPIVTEEDLEEVREIREYKAKRKAKIIKCILIVGLIITAILLFLLSPLFNVKTILVEGNKRISTEQIISLSKIKIDTNTFKINNNSVINEIKEDVYIEEVEIRRELPSTIILSIKEREPSYLIEYANGYVCIDKKGYILSISETKQELPVLQGIETPNEKFIVGNRLDTNDLNKIYMASKIMDIAKENTIDGLITRIDVENINNVKLIFEFNEKTAYIGENSNLNLKILIIKQILEKTEGLAGEIFVNKDLDSEYPVFRERV